ncbi:myb family transcription factor EFM-like protein [Cinnamomum micranthum f. kanehirae]|uniref:Myb family transcription factor EFM-like protein n=1 Tax=Cinnamomum micranthum f. kanehirae TaxID=337451 RepID=A0A3S3MPP7_9MAGN|nr:myb family transcription factor EFM-like protein [Cinnamomum micranthum f. kanehirae]
MGSPSELSLDCKPSSYSLLLKSFGDQSNQTQKIEEFLARLEEERHKIDAFKRELPLCMQLLNNAMEASRLQLETCQTNQGSKPVLEEFIPLKQPSSEGQDRASNMSEKSSWMTTAQLWSQTNDGTKHQPAATTTVKETDTSFGVSPKLTLDNKQRNGGAFHPFSRERNICTNPPIQALPELALASLDTEMEEKKCLEPENLVPCPRRESCSKGGAGATVEQGKGAANTTEGQTMSTATTQTHRKARRCWSPDLHHRFVNALQMLGGSQVATPKQIRELMKVDGLTNDEVKSHLQKYRLHTRRSSPSRQASATPAPQLVVLGGIWVPPEYATAAHGAATALYGPHSGPHATAHYPVGQDFYPAPPHPFHHPHHHHFRAPSHTQSSPESDVRAARDRSESIEEDGKSESSSWKGGESGENDDRGAKGLLSLRDEGDESNGSEITLKF